MGVFAQHKLLPDGCRVGVEPEPQRKNRECDCRAERCLEGGRYQDPASRLRSSEEGRSPQRGAGRGNQRKGLVEGADAKTDAADQVQPERRGAGCCFGGACGNPQISKQGQAEPEGLGCRGQVGPAVSEGGEKQQIHRGCNAGLPHAAADAPGQQAHQRGGQQRIHHAGQTQRSHGPVTTPVARHQGLPKQHGRLGVAHVVEFAGQGQPLAGLRRGTGDVHIDQLIAIGWRVRAVQAQKIQQHHACDQQHPRPQRCGRRGMRLVHGWGFLKVQRSLAKKLLTLATRIASTLASM